MNNQKRLSTPLRLTACPASWETMRGDQRVRWCEPCGHRVYDPDTTGNALLDLIYFHEGLRPPLLFQTKDGKVLANPCQSAQRNAWRRIMVAGILSTITGFLCMAGSFVSLTDARTADRRSPVPITAAVELKQPARPATIAPQDFGAIDREELESPLPTELALPTTPQGRLPDYVVQALLSKQQAASKRGPEQDLVFDSDESDKQHSPH